MYLIDNIYQSCTNDSQSTKHEASLENDVLLMRHSQSFSPIYTLKCPFFSPTCSPAVMTKLQAQNDKLQNQHVQTD